MPGAHAVAVAACGRIILVKLTYARGWRLPGGGIKIGEDPLAGVLRELREEIGMTSHGAAHAVPSTRDPAILNENSHLFVVRDVRRRWRPNVEIRRVGLFDQGAMPNDISPITRRFLAAASSIL